MQKLVVLVFTCYTIMGISPNNSSLADAYISAYKSIAISEMQRSGIPASIKLAQGLMESDWGRSDLATVGNNHFGIKCGGSWTGGTYYKEDDDYDKDGKLKKSCFRAYANVAESYIAHTEFLSKPRSSKRYDFLFLLRPTDYKGWAHGLSRAGYATDPKYPQKLITIIEKYNLHQFDIAPETIVPERELVMQQKPSIKKEKETKEVENNAIVETTLIEPIKQSSETVEEINRVPMVLSRTGDTPASIAKRHSKSYSQLREFNEEMVNRHDVLKEGTIVYLDRKKRRYNGEADQHKVKEGESMYQISQLYGIKLKNLYVKNRLPSGAQPLVGEKLNLGRMVKIGKRPKFITAEEYASNDEQFLFEDPSRSN